MAALIARGLTNAQIATTLTLSKRTAEWHVSSLLSKFGVTTRPQLAASMLQEARPRQDG